MLALYTLAEHSPHHWKPMDQPQELLWKLSLSLSLSPSSCLTLGYC